MLEAIWEWFLDLTALLVTPDWGSLIALLPIAIMVMVLVWVIWMFRRFRAQPKARRGKMPVPRKTPAGIHMPGPSFAPVFAAIGAALLFFGMVYGGPILLLGILALTLTLLYWLAEGIRIYDHEVGTTVPALPAVVHDGPPPGVHMPGPSFRPILGAIGVAILFLGLVYGGWMLIAGVLAMVATLVGWLFDAVKEYGRTLDADRTGHLDSGPAPRTPSLMFSLLAVVLVGGDPAPDRPAAADRGERLGRGRRRVAGTVRIGRGARLGRAGVPAPGRHGRRQHHRPADRLRRDVVHREGRHAVHDRVRQRGRRRHPQHRDQSAPDGTSESGRARSSRASRRGSTTSRPWPPASTSSSAPSIRP